MGRSQKHCSRLWNGMVIRHDGYTYPCCNVGSNKEFSMGNIYDHTMEEMINGSRIQELRKLSLESRLPCFENCDQVKLFEAHPIPLPSTTESRVEDYRDLQIEYGEICNVDCIMCWQDRNNRQVLKYEILKEKLPLDPWRSINAYGGEVFIIPDARRHIFEILGMSQKVLTVTTNGMNLGSAEMMELLVTRAKEVIVSVNAAHETYHTMVMKPKKPFFEVMMANVARLRKLKEEKGSSLLLVGHFTAVIETLFEIPIYLQNFRSMGFDKATVNFDHRHFPHFFAQNPQTTSRLSELLHQVIDQHPNRDRITICQMEHIQ